eukprot:COSAG02_NODE_2842_length_7911_cov_6.273682_9_plen_114_part_00
MTNELADNLTGHALRQAANKKCGVQESSCYSEEEMIVAITDIVFNDGSTSAHARYLGMGGSTLRRHASAAKQYCKTFPPGNHARRAVCSFVKQLRRPGRPTFLMPDDGSVRQG